jgi:hypothetical protein
MEKKSAWDTIYYNILSEVYNVYLHIKVVLCSNTKAHF